MRNSFSTTLAISCTWALVCAGTIDVKRNSTSFVPAGYRYEALEGANLHAILAAIGSPQSSLASAGMNQLMVLLRTHGRPDFTRFDAERPELADFAASNGAVALIAALHLHAAHENVVLPACNLIDDLSTMPTVSAALVQADAVGALLQVLRAFTGRDSDFVTTSLSSIERLSLSSETAQPFLDGDGIVALVDALRVYHRTPTGNVLSRYLCNFMGAANGTAVHGQASNALAATGGVAVLLERLSPHRSSTAEEENSAVVRALLIAMSAPGVAKRHARDALGAAHAVPALNIGLEALLHSSFPPLLVDAPCVLVTTYVHLMALATQRDEVAAAPAVAHILPTLRQLLPEHLPQCLGDSSLADGLLTLLSAARLVSEADTSALAGTSSVPRVLAAAAAPGGRTLTAASDPPPHSSNDG